MTPMRSNSAGSKSGGSGGPAVQPPASSPSPGLAGTGGATMLPPYPGPNPYTTGMFHQAADAVQGRMGNAMAGMGLSNSGVNQTFTNQLNNLATGLFGQAYDADMNRAVNMREGDLNRQQAAVFGVPGLMSSITQYGLGLGDVVRNTQQQQIDSAVAQWNAAQQQPLLGLDVLGQSLSMAAGAGGGINAQQSNPGQFGPTSTAGMLSGWSPI